MDIVDSERAAPRLPRRPSEAPPQRLIMGLMLLWVLVGSFEADFGAVIAKSIVVMKIGSNLGFEAPDRMGRVRRQGFPGTRGRTLVFATHVGVVSDPLPTQACKFFRTYGLAGFSVTHREQCDVLMLPVKACHV